MTVRRVMGTEVEYGISVPGQPDANPMIAVQRRSSTRTAVPGAAARRPRGTSRRSRPCVTPAASTLAAAGAGYTDLDEDTGMANVILTNGARLYVDHAHPEYSTPEVPTPATSSCGTRRGSG